MIKIWKQRNPAEWKSFIVHLDDTKQAQKRKWVGRHEWTGVTKDKESGAYFSMVVDFPVWIMQALRKLYNSDELPMDKKFFERFAREFPEFAIRKKI